MSSNIAISVKNLCQRFGKKQVLDNLTFSAPLGAITGFLGLNGAGKTTTMRILLGLIPCAKGEISILGHKMPDERIEALEQTGAVVENPAFIEYMTAHENLRYFGNLIKPIPEGRIEEVLADVGLQDVGKKAFSTFSSGMKQRLGVAFGLLHKPKLLILDEPTSGMDPAGRAHMRDILLNIHAKEGTSVFLSSHYIDEVQRLCDYVVIIDSGKTVSEGYVSALLRKDAENYELRVADKDFERALALLNGMSDLIQNVKRTSRGLVFTSSAGKVSDINKILVEKDIEVKALIPIEVSLEETFLKLTEKSDQTKKQEV